MGKSMTELLQHPLVEAARDYAIRAHAETNHLYDGRPYAVHLSMVVERAVEFLHLLEETDRPTALAGAWVHDAIEDARQTYNDVKKATDEAVAEVAFALTNEKGRTRKERANARYYEGIRACEVATFVKICDRLANAGHSVATKSRMQDVYRRELAEFRAALYSDRFAPMWAALEQLLAG
jgi:(p)ppGpp synthase/HD superfamily hydrolase